jgi:hypothetical protein
VLVTASAPGQVLMQCFPVERDGGEMQVRLGVTAPLAPAAGGRWTSRLPRFAERNFEVPPATRHDVRVEGRGLASAGPHLRPEPVGRDGVALRGRLDEASSGASIESAAPRPAVWAASPVERGKAVRQVIRQEERAAVKRLIVVADGSARMGASLERLADALAGLPRGADVRLLVAGDAVLDLSGRVELLRSFEAAGGRDNVPALLRACEMVEGSAPAAIVWAHGPQPVALTPVDGLQDRLRRLPRGVTLYDLPLAAGPNVALAGRPFFAVRPVRGDADLGGLLRSLVATERVTRLVREMVPLDEAREQGAEAPAHLVRLWAAEEVARPAPASPSQATALAVKHRLVTPLTGAVVLETKEQYERAGLELPDDLKDEQHAYPGKPGMLAHGPEPAWWLLGAVVAVALGVERWRRPRRRAA